MRPELIALRDVLADLYSEREIERILDQAGIPYKMIELKGGTIDQWHRIVKYAESNDQVNALIDVAVEERPRHRQLRDAADRYRSTHGAKNAEKQQRRRRHPYALAATAAALVASLVVVLTLRHIGDRQPLVAIYDAYGQPLPTNPSLEATPGDSLLIKIDPRQPFSAQANHLGDLAFDPRHVPPEFDGIDVLFQGKSLWMDAFAPEKPAFCIPDDRAEDVPAYREACRAPNSPRLSCEQDKSGLLHHPGIAGVVFRCASAGKTLGELIGLWRDWLLVADGRIQQIYHFTPAGKVQAVSALVRRYDSNEDELIEALQDGKIWPIEVKLKEAGTTSIHIVIKRWTPANMDLDTRTVDISVQIRSRIER